MLEFEADEVQNPLFTVSGAVPPEEADQQEAALESLEAGGTLKSWFRGESRFTIADPIITPLDLTNEPLAQEIKDQLDKFDFYRVQFVCAFDPAEQCRFHTARFDVAISTAPTPPNTIAYDLFPARVEDQLTVSRKFSFDPTLKLKAGPVDTGISGILKAEIGKEYISYTSQILSGGAQTGQAHWNFKRTDSHKIEGDYKLIMVARKPKKSQASLNLSLNASLEVLIPFGFSDPIPLTTTKRKKGTIVETMEITF